LWTIGLLLRHRYHFVHAHEEAIFWCNFLRPIFRFKLVYDMHSSLPQQLTNFGFTRSKVLIDIFDRLERACLRNADAVVTICPDLQDHALQTGLDPHRHVLIENSLFDDVRLKHAPRAAQRPQQDEDVHNQVLEAAGPVVLYAGTFEPYQGVDLLLAAFARVLEREPAAILLLVGGSPPQIEEKRRRARTLGIDRRCVFTGQVSKRCVSELTARAHVLVSPRTGGTNTPLKIYEQLASGKPLVATRIWSHTQVLAENVCILVEPEPEALAAGILRALHEGSTHVSNARALYESAYSRPAYEAKVRRLLELVA
jgi:glycosyltransferase involved in cell wall biosynthesis